MNNKNFDEKLIKKSYGLISKKYSTESGKKFILHLISAFIINNPEEATIENSNKVESLECCINRCHILPIGMPVPSNVGVSYHGLVSNKSDKIISLEAYEALKRFIEYRLNNNDDVVLKIKSYMEKDKKEYKKPYIHKNKQIRESRATYEDTDAIPKPTLS